MPDFSSSDEMLAAMQSHVHGALRSLLPAFEEVGQMFKADAQSRIGSYQEAEGPFPAWAQLANATQDERERKGFTRNDPLLRRGLVRDSIEVAATAESVKVGVPDKIVDGDDGKPIDIGVVAEALEKGTDHIPPRSYLGQALFHMRERATAIINEAIAKRLRG